MITNTHTGSSPRPSRGITVPGPRLLRDLPFTFMSHGRRQRRQVDARVTLIPFIDLLLTVVVFLLASFSASPEMGAPETLPFADHGESEPSGAVIVVDQDHITVDGRRLAETRSLLDRHASPPTDPLIRDLSTVRENFHVLHPQESGEAPLVVLASQEVDYRAVRLVLESASRAGFGTVQLAVRPR